MTTLFSKGLNIVSWVIITIIEETTKLPIKHRKVITNLPKSVLI